MPISIRFISHSLCKNLAKDISSCDSGRRNNLFPLSISLCDSRASCALLIKGEIISSTFSSLIWKALAAAKNHFVLPSTPNGNGADIISQPRCLRSRTVSLK